MFENVSFCQPLGAAFDSPGERGLGALSRLPRNRPNCLTIRDNRVDWVLFLGNYLLRYGIKLLLGGFTYLEPSRDDLKERSASPTRIAVFRVAEQVENAGDRPAIGDKGRSCDAKFY